MKRVIYTNKKCVENQARVLSIRGLGHGYQVALEACRCGEIHTIVCPTNSELLRLGWPERIVVPLEQCPYEYF